MAPALLSGLSVASSDLPSSDPLVSSKWSPLTTIEHSILSISATLVRSIVVGGKFVGGEVECWICDDLRVRQVMKFTFTFINDYDDLKPNVNHRILRECTWFDLRGCTPEA